MKNTFFEVYKTFEGQNIDFSRDNDIIIQEKCDEVSSKIVKMSGWETDFDQIQNQTLKL